MTPRSKRKTSGLRQLILTLILVTIASAGASAQTPTNTFPNNGNAGVGTTTPITDLEVKNSSHAAVTVNSGAGSTDASILFQRAGVNQWFLQSRNSGTPTDSFALYDGVNTTFRLVVNRSGNIGIGTTNPLGKFHLVTPSYTDTAIPVWDNRFLVAGADSNTGGMSLSYNQTTNTGYLMTLSPNVAWRNTVIQPFGGNVGIGTTAPIGPLAVGNSAVANSDGYIVLGKRDGSSGSRQFRVGFDSSFNFVIGDYGNNNTAGSWLSPFAINWQAPSNSFYINSDGKIGMGMTTPPNYKLDVNGEINATGFRINGTPISGGGAPQWTPSGASIYYSSGRVGIGGAGDNVYATDAWVENNMHVQGPETLAQGGRGRLRVGSAWGYSGLYADASSTAGVNDLVLGASSGTVRVGPGGAAIQNLTVPNGNVGIGTPPSTYKLDVHGNTNVTGNLNVTGTVNAKYQDLAEWVPSSEQLSPGTVVVLDTTKSNQVISSTASYNTRVAGVISSQPGITLGESGEGKVLVATTGRVRVKVDASRGAIQIGDLLVTSDVPGVAMKSEPVEFAGRKMHMPGTIIGKALEPLAKGSGEILVLLSLQ